MIESRYMDLPVAAAAAAVNGALAVHGRAVVTAPPGAGKSTLLPLTVLEALREGRLGEGACPLGEGRIVMLEPRRIAARQIAERMATMLGETVGKTVGYRIRFESRVSRETRIEVVTEGILTRMLADDPTLEGVAAIIFDEFHERSLNSDAALALTLESQSIIRPDLKLLIMSATIDTKSICAALDAPLVESGGRMYPVTTINSAEDFSPSDAAVETARAVLKAWREQTGSILAFLPGEGEIRRCGELLQGSLEDEVTDICPLYGMLPFEEQRRALVPSPEGRRKIVLATPIAETSLTIEGIRTVVDSGLCRRMVFDPASGLSHMETVRISRDMADQRAGRAGRLSEGVCYRLWSSATDRRMAPTRTPEIMEADLCSMVLDIAAWGEKEPSRLKWLTPPPAFRLRQACELLKLLGALDEDGSITARGRALASLPAHPRIAGMMLSAASHGLESTACDIAAILEEKDPMSQNDNDSDLSSRVNALRQRRERTEGSRNDFPDSLTGGFSSGPPSGRGRQWSRIERISRQYRLLMRAAEDNSPVDAYSIGVLLAEAYPERIAHAVREGSGEFMLACGGTASVGRDDCLASYDWIAVAGMDAGGTASQSGRIFLAAPLDPSDVPHMVRERDIIAWDSRTGAVAARHERRIGGLMLDSRPLHDISRAEIDRVLCESAPKEGLSMFDFGDEKVGNLQRRVACVSSWHPESGIPDLSTDAVLSRAAEWLPLYSNGARNVMDLKRIDLAAAIWSLLDYEQQQTIDRLAPTHITVPTGSSIRVEYRQGAEAPVLRVRLQECFGMLDTPRVDGGTRPVLMELLSPGFKPVQLTSDLRSFWQGTYFEVRKELRQRYPKHSWPDNPLEAEAVRGIPKHK
ncbi:MAG: ATP-dependent helicase HrpB [Bacteroidales bacterium]|nr:ATP-dependent helicase HrpB [Bacteroidales bacterium]